MKQLPRISIITPSFNQSRFIERTILSVLDQGYPNLEFIVMDGGSTDGTVDILKKYAGRLQWISERDRGQADAINKGIRRSTGDIMAYLNSDDVYEPGALKLIADNFAEHPETMWLTGKCRIIDEHDREVRKPITAYKNCLLKHFSYSLLLVTNPISQPATFWRRQVLDEVGLFNEAEHMVMDYDLWLRIAKLRSLAIIGEYLAGFRVYAETKTSSQFLKGFRRELELAKDQSNSRFLNVLHWANYLLISIVYLLLAGRNKLLRKK